MTALFPDAELNADADARAARITHASLHTANPDTDGSDEATGGAPAYERQPVTFAVAGAEGPLGATLQPATVGVAWSDEVTFDAPAGTYTHGGTWSASTGGTFRGGNALGTSQDLSSQGQVKLSVKVGPYIGD